MELGVARFVILAITLGAALTTLTGSSRLPFLRCAEVVECFATGRTSYVSNTEPVIDAGIVKDVSAWQQSYFRV